MDFSERLKILRNNKGMTQEQLGDVIEMSKGNVSKLENGIIEPSLKTLKDLANFFDVSVDYLIAYKLNDKNNDASDIAIQIDNIIAQLAEQKYVMLYGKSPDTDTYHLVYDSIKLTHSIIHNIQK